MPAFDPVRDAVLNSPVTSSLALPQSARMYADAANAKSPHPGASSHPRHPPPSAPGPGMSIVTSASLSSTTTSPSEQSPGTALISPLTRRATDLSMLLNDSGPMDTPLFTPTTPRAPAGLTHLLLHDSDDGADVEQLSQFTPMRRRSSATMSETSTGTSRESSYFTHLGSIIARPSSSSASHGVPFQRESFGLALPGTAGAPPPTSASMSLAFPPSSGSRPSTAVSIASGPPTSRPSTAGQPPGSSSSAVSASMPPPAQAPQRSPLISSAVTAARAPPSKRATRPPSPTKPVPSPISVLPTAPTPPVPVPAPTSVSAPASTPAPPPAPSSSSIPPTTMQKPPPPPRQHSGSGNSVSRKTSSSITPKPQSSLPPPSASLPPKPERPPSPPPSQMKRSTVPYAPRRITPAGSVLIPLSPAEMEKYRNYSGGVGTMILRKKKRVENLLGDGPVKREREDEDSEESPRKKRRSGDVAVVVEHYNARPDVGVAQRQESPIIGLKSFNNWVKSVLITRFAHPVLAASPGQWRGRMRGRVLDMGCGKGGDLTKWAKANVAEYIGLDIAAVSVDQARQRHGGSRGARFTAEFFALDCYTTVLSDALPPNLLSTPFDVVSMQFCMHYAFESEAKARIMLRNVATWLRPSGMFIGTIPNAQQLMEHLDELPEDAKDLSWGNSVYKIRFEDRHQRPIFGHRYWFYLQDAVDDVPEYVVHWDNFVRLASEYGLQLVYKKEFHEIYEEHSEHPDFAPLLQRMRVVDANGESQMDEDQWEAANVYIGFAFEKR
ncbi:hypothetical protein L226DRAFT_510173 [Lentinus tigrinus ALCF2SS1-7]|uniref:mRNA cap guanine-N(7) methyltransferase n=1 Tax=Lentinus tigrinus ALCF2SS1-6 TaxID=1328759 RepID=A0A5C2S7P5_9APHY|nr:hypothetical protein L227DRAFT_654130 [Lentinus tigrinus ALCF2SS1-6]RPD73435.1 hypothetical protein L226DRAFT_510173 [Lentinus tigrinus ALCF2SS1-7]